MKNINWQKLKSIFWGRAGQNIFGWGLFTGFWIYSVPVGHDYAEKWYWLFRFCIFGLVIGLCCFNNFVLLPKLLARKKYVIYIITIAIATLATSFCFHLTLKLMNLYFPKIQSYQVSFIMTEVYAGWDTGSLMQGMMTHFYFVLEFVIMLTMAWYIRQYDKQQRVLEEARRKQVETELNFLKTQINPHFLFNTLNNIYGLALKKTDESPQSILRLSAILRYLLYESNAEKVSFEKEKEVAEAYIGLEMLRLPDKDALSFSIQADREYTIPPLLWLPILENTFKHGMRVITDNYLINFNFEIVDNEMVIFSQNNFKPNGAVHAGSGIGLQNLEKRLGLLYPHKHSLKTWNDDKYYFAELKIKLS